MKKSLNPKSNGTFSFFFFFFSFMFLWDRINAEQRLIPKSNFISFLKKRWIIDKLEKTLCLEKTMVTNVKRLEMENYIVIRTLQKLKIISMKFLFFSIFLGKINKNALSTFDFIWHFNSKNCEKLQIFGLIWLSLRIISNVTITKIANSLEMKNLLLFST